MRERSGIMTLIMNKLNTAERVQIIAALVEGNSVNSVCRMTGRSIHTVLKLLVDAGTACKAFHDAKVRNLKTKRLQADEIWNFCYAKEKNVPAEFKGQFGYGDCWTWVGIDADSKLIISYLTTSTRDGGHAHEFMRDIAGRLANRVQVTTDGLNAYWDAVCNVFSCNVDFAQLIKIYGPDYAGEGKYSPAECVGIKVKTRTGDPDPAHISTSFVERSNLTMRMNMRRFTRLTNGFSKKVENMQHAVALNFFHYNFCRLHKTLRVTPAMEAGLTDHVWEIENLVELLD